MDNPLPPPPLSGHAPLKKYFFSASLKKKELKKKLLFPTANFRLPLCSREGGLRLNDNAAAIKKIFCGFPQSIQFLIYLRSFVLFQHVFDFRPEKTGSLLKNKIFYNLILKTYWFETTF